MNTSSKPDQAQPKRALEHASVAGPEGEIHYLQFVNRDESNRSESSFGVDWWRTPVAPKGLVRRWLDTVKTKLRGEP